MALNDKHKRFCEEYLVDLNATQAYLRAGYRVSERVAAVNALRLLAKPEVQVYLARRRQELQKKTEITQERVLAELAAIGFANGSDFARIVEKPLMDIATGIPVVDRLTDKPKTYQDIELINTSDLSEEKKKALAGIKYGKYGIVVEACDKVRALELLGKHLGLFEPRDVEQPTDNSLLTALNKSTEEVWSNVPEVQPEADAGDDLVEPPTD